MEVKREVVLELAVAALLKASGVHQDDLVQRANAQILGGKLDEIAGGTDYKSAACSAIAEIAQRI